MRSVHISIVVLLVCFCNAMLIAMPFSDAVSVNTVSLTQTIVEFTLPEFKLTEITENGTIFHQIELIDAYEGGDIGLPNLPHFSATFAIPIGSVVSFENVVYSEPRFMQTLPIVPVQNTDDPHYTFDYDTGFYLSKDPKQVYPQKLYYMSDVMTMRDYQFVVVKIHPFRYHPVTNTLEIVDSFWFSVSHPTDDPNPRYSMRPVISKAFERLYENIIQNYDQVRSPNPIYQQPTILLIYGGSNHSTSFTTNLNRIINQKKQKGFVITAVGTGSTGTNGYTYQVIKSYIQTLYNNTQNRPEWIILVGDVNGDYNINAGNNDPSDYPYTHLEGNDTLGDAFIGRISVETEGQLNNYWNKINKYEMNLPNPTDPALYKKAFLAGNSANSGISTWMVNRYIKSLMLDYDPTFNITESYYSSNNVSILQNGLNPGQAHYNFRGYLQMDNLSISSITNTNVLTNAIFMTCSTGTFSNTSQTEDMMRLEYQNSPAGAITAIGLSTSGTHTVFNNTLTGSVWYALYALNVDTIGEALLYSKLYSKQAYPVEGTMESIIHWANIMGDPTIHTFKTTPRTFSTVLPTEIPAGTQGLRFNIMETGGSNVSDAYVTITKVDGSYVSRTVSDTEGIAYLPLDPSQTGPFMITISKPGFHPKQSIPLVEVVGNSVTVTDIMINDIQGNGNQTINPGETVHLTIQVKNFQPFDVSNLSATIYSESEYVTLGDVTTTTVGSITTGLEVNIPDAFTFSVSPLAPDKILLPLVISITDGSSTWVSYVLPEVRAIDLKVTTITPVGQAYVSIGTPANITFTLKNEGTIPSGELQVQLVSGSLYMTASNATVTIPNIAIGSTAISAPFTVNVADFMIAGMKLKADLHISNSTGFETVIPVSILVGNKVVGDPTGPDDYGYVIYHSADTDTDARPVYNWINIANIGTNTGMNDTSPTQEEASVHVNLPFTAGFYGQQYNDITICSNGWIAFGTTEQKDFRNLPLPGAIAPKKLIAPYWTDQIVGGSYGGGVYTYYHPTEHAFIVQFDKMRWVLGYGGNSYSAISADSVSYQVLIYDPAYNGTALGDSQIKIQYRRFAPGLAGSGGSSSNYIRFVTVGIQDHTAKLGIQYLDNDIYALGSNTITNGTALLITQPSFLVELPFLQVSRAYYHPESGGTEVKAGERTNIGVSLLNVGMTPAVNVQATLSFESPYVQTVNATTTYPDIESYLTQSNLEYFTIYIDPSIPNNTSVTGRLHITADDVGETPVFWEREISFNVIKPNIQYRSYLVNDSAPGGNNDGIVDPGESIKLIVNITNPTNLEVKDLQASITTDNSSVTINSATFDIPKMRPSSVYQTVFEITTDANISGSALIPIVFTATSQNSSPMDRVIWLGINQSTSIFQEVFDDWYPPGWTFASFSTSWSRSYTNNAGGNSPEIAFAGPATDGTTRLVSPAINTTDINRVLLTFNHNLIMAPQAGTGTSIGVATRRSNTDAWVTVWTQQVTTNIAPRLQSIDINNSTLGYATTQFCFFVSGSLGNIQNWYIDNATIQNNIGNSATISGVVTTSDRLSSAAGLKITAGDYSTHVRPDGTYSMYLIPRSYPTLSVVDPYYSGNMYYFVNPTPGAILTDYDFTLNYKATADTIWVDRITPIPDSEDIDVTLKWRHVYDTENNPLNFTRFNIYRQVNSTQFNLLVTSQVPEYTVRVNPANIYRYYITATYASGESEHSPIKYINPANIEEEDAPPEEPNEDADEVATPLTFALNQNYPNPFNPTTNISFSLPADSHVNVSVYNIKGQLVKTLLSEYVSRGRHTIQWHGDNSLGHSVGSGIYLIRVNDSSHTAVKKALLLK